MFTITDECGLLHAASASNEYNYLICKNIYYKTCFDMR